MIAGTPDGRALSPAPPLTPEPEPEPAITLAQTIGPVDPTAIHTHDGGPLSLDDSLYVLLQSTPA